jgi:hypothetical protein
MPTFEEWDKLEGGQNELVWGIGDECMDLWRKDHDEKYVENLMYDNYE